MRWALYLGLVLAISATFVQCQEDAKPSEVIEDPKPVSEEPIEAADELKQDEPVEEVDDEEKIEDPEAIDDPKESEESSDGSEVSEDSEVSEEFPNAVSAEEDLTPDSNDKFDGEESSENDETEGEEIDEDYVNDQGVEELILPPGDEDDIPIPPPPPPPKDEEEKECREDLKGNEGKFSSANFPDAYPERSNCSWNIEVDEE